MTAENIDAELHGLRRAHAGWLILFGVYTRRYVAHGYMLDRPGIWVTAGTAAELHRRIGLVESAYR
jgi:hypothetical protein